MEEEECIILFLNKYMEEKVLKYFSHWFRKPTPELILNKKIIGNDVDEILIVFFIEFEIDYKTFEFEKYFEEERDLSDLFKMLFFREKKKYPLLTIKHLIKVAEKGEWFDPEDIEK